MPTIRLLKLPIQKFDFFTFEESEWLLGVVADNSERLALFLPGGSRATVRRDHRT